MKLFNIAYPTVALFLAATLTFNHQSRSADVFMETAIQRSIHRTMPVMRQHGPRDRYKHTWDAEYKRMTSAWWGNPAQTSLNCTEWYSSKTHAHGFYNCD
jgi:hypothetical protein